MKKFVSLIKDNNRLFEDILSLKELASENLEDRIAILQTAASFAWLNHTGRFTSAEIDKNIRQIGREININTNNNIQESTSKVLFISTELYVTGGHTKLLENIAKFESDLSSEVTLIVTRQKLEDLPNRLTSNSEVFKKIICLSGKSLKEQVSSLLLEIDASARVYNIQHPDDIVISVALSLRRSSKVIYVNHADHVFWVGAAFCDRILNIRPYAEKLTLERRVSNIPSFVIPIKIGLSKMGMTRSEAKLQLGLSESYSVLLTISSFYKVTPDDNYNFFALIEEILLTYSNIIYYFVGVTNQQYVELNGKEPPPNLVLLGLLEDPSLYQYAADLYLEGMPMNSLTACIDSIYRGAYPIFMWGPYHVNMNMDSEIYFKNLVQHPKNKEVYMSVLKEALDPASKMNRDRIVNQIKSNIIEYSSDSYWRKTILDCNPILQAELNAKEYDIDIRDLRLAEASHTFWKGGNIDPKVQILKFLRPYIKLQSLLKLYYRNIGFNKDIDFLKRIKMLRQIFL